MRLPEGVSAMTFTMLGLENPRRVRAGIVTGNYFEVSGLSASLGRTIGPEDGGQGAPAVIVLLGSVGLVAATHAVLLFAAPQLMLGADGKWMLETLGGFLAMKLGRFSRMKGHREEC